MKNKIKMSKVKKVIIITFAIIIVLFLIGIMILDKLLFHPYPDMKPEKHDNNATQLNIPKKIINNSELILGQHYSKNKITNIYRDSNLTNPEFNLYFKDSLFSSFNIEFDDEGYTNLLLLVGPDKINRKKRIENLKYIYSSLIEQYGKKLQIYNYIEKHSTLITITWFLKNNNFVEFVFYHYEINENMNYEDDIVNSIFSYRVFFYINPSVNLRREDEYISKKYTPKSLGLE